MSTHYVAQLKIEKVEKVDLRVSLQSSIPSEPKREISEVTQLTIKGDTLESLVLKLGKHIQIIEED